MVIFLSDLNADDDTVTSTSQFIREEVIFTPAAGTLSTYAYMYFWILYGVWMETIAKAQKRVGKINYALALIHTVSLSHIYKLTFIAVAMIQLSATHLCAHATLHNT